MDRGDYTFAFVLLTILLVVVVTWGLGTIWHRFEKNRRIPTEGTVTFMRSKKKSRWVQTGGSTSTMGYSQDYLEITMDFEFCVDGKQWTGAQTVGGQLGAKKEGDRIRVYYLPSSPGKHQIIEA